MGRIQKKKPAEQKKKQQEKRKRKQERAAKGEGPSSGASAASQGVIPVVPKPASGAGVTATVLRGPKFWVTIVQFIIEVRLELKKVAWPSRKQTVGSTIVVIILTLIISLFLGIADLGLSNLVRWVLQ